MNRHRGWAYAVVACTFLLGAASVALNGHLSLAGHMARVLLVYFALKVIVEYILYRAKRRD